MAQNAMSCNSKKRKTDVNQQLFMDFLSKSDKCGRLLRAVDDLLNGSGPIPLVACAMQILEADANLCKSFDNVYCHARCYFDGTPITISIGTLFIRGCCILLEYLKNRKVPDDKELQDILMILIAFLGKENTESSALFESTSGESGCDWCIRASQHLYSQLSYQGEYTIDSRHVESFNRKTCPCSTRDELIGKVGDTSFGCPTLWHGSTDLIFGMEMPVQVVMETDDTAELESGTSDAETTEPNSTENDFSLKDKYQLRGAVIGFGFYNHKLERQKENPKYTLTPLIGFSKNKMKFLFYDSVNDVLLETSAHDLCCYKNKLSYHIILTVWLVMNYKWFGDETPVDLRRYKSGLHSMFPLELQTYTNDIEAPCHPKSSLQKEASLPNYCKYFISDGADVSKEVDYISIDDL